jgi:hypothetical protein
LFLFPTTDSERGAERVAKRFRAGSRSSDDVKERIRHAVFPGFGYDLRKRKGRIYAVPIPDVSRNAFIINGQH